MQGKYSISRRQPLGRDHQSFWQELFRGLGRERSLPAYLEMPGTVPKDFSVLLGVSGLNQLGQ